MVFKPAADPVRHMYCLLANVVPLQTFIGMPALFLLNCARSFQKHIVMSFGISLRGCEPEMKIHIMP